MQDYIPIQKDINEKLPTVTVKQYDNLSRFIHIQIFDKDLPDLPDDEKYFNLENCTARLYIQPKGDDSGEDVEYIDGEVADGEIGIVTFLLPSSITETAGNYEGEIWIYGAETSRPIISTKPFDFVVEKSIRNNSAIEGTSKFTALDNALFQVALNKARIDNLVASSSNGGVVPGETNAELIDLREGYDGTTYATAGNAVRAQIEAVYENRRAATAAEFAAAMGEDYNENEEINEVVNALQTVLLQAQNFQHQITSLRRQVENVAALIPDGSVASEKLSAALQRPDNVISTGTVAEMLWCAETYFGKAYTADGNPSHILYETGNGLYSESLGDNAANGQYGIVCSSFVDAILNGVTFNNSRYNNNNASNTGQAWGVVFDDTIPFGRTENPNATEIANRYLTSQALAKYAAAHGYLYRIDGMQNIRAGDVVFSGDISDRYLGIDHVAIVINASSTHLSVIEAADDAVKADGNPVGLRINKRKLSYFTYGATFPLGSVENHVNMLETATGARTVTSNSDGYTTLHTFAKSVDRGFYTVVCHGTFPASPYITVTYDGSNSGTGQGSMHRVGNDCYLTFYAQKPGIASVLVTNDGNTYTPSEMTLYRGYADILAVADKDQIYIVTPEMYGAAGDGITDDTAAIQQTIDNNYGKSITFRGKYLISSTISTPSLDANKVALHFCENASFIAKNGFSGNYMIAIGGKNNGESSYSHSYSDCGLYGANLDCNNICGGVSVEHVHLAKIEHVVVNNVKGTGLFIGRSNNSSADVYINYFTSFGSDANDINNIGLHIDSSDNKIYHVRVSGCCIGVNLTGGGNYLEDAHPLYTKYSSNSNYEQSIAFNIAADRQILTNCYADTFSAAINLTDDYAFQASHFYAYWYNSFQSKCTVINMEQAGSFRGTINWLLLGFASDGENYGLVCPDLYHTIRSEDYGIRGVEIKESSFNRMKYPNYDLIWRTDITHHSYMGVKKADIATGGYFFVGALWLSSYKINGVLKSYAQGDCANLTITMSSSGTASITATAVNAFSGKIEFALANPITVGSDTYYGLYVKQTAFANFAMHIDNIVASPVLPITLNRNAISEILTDIKATYILNG